MISLYGQEQESPFLKTYSLNRYSLLQLRSIFRYFPVIGIDLDGEKVIRNSGSI